MTAPRSEAELDEWLRRHREPASLARALEEGLRARGIWFGENLLPAFLRPHFVAAPLFDRWIADTEALFALVERIIAQIVDGQELARYLGFPPELVELLSIDPGYRKSVIVARPDAVYRGTSARFIEVNCDSPAMMTFADELEELLSNLLPLSELAPAPPRRVESLLAALLACYREQRGSGAPTIAIVDWPGEKTAHELLRTAARFRALGTDALVCGPADLRYRGGLLLARDRPIDLVYRRVLCRDFLTRRDELAPLLSAYRDGAVCMANPLRSYAAGTKALLALLHDEKNPAGLSAEERDLVDRTIPTTRYVSPDRPPERARWVLKKAESYGGKHVLVGSITDDEEWRRGVAAGGEELWVQQEAEEVPRLELPELDGERLRFAAKFCNWNPFVFGGRHGGSITRVSETILINISRGGGLLPTLRVSENAAKLA